MIDSGWTLYCKQTTMVIQIDSQEWRFAYVRGIAFWVSHAALGGVVL